MYPWEGLADQFSNLRRQAEALEREGAQVQEFIEWDRDRPRPAVYPISDYVQLSSREVAILTSNKWYNSTLFSFWMEAVNSIQVADNRIKVYSELQLFCQKNRRVEYPQLQEVLVPFNYKEEHWLCLRFILSNPGRLQLYNSITSYYQQSQIRQYAKKYFSNYGITRYSLVVANCEQQKNGYDCGVHVCRNLAALRFKISQRLPEVNTYRMKMYLILRLMHSRPDNYQALIKLFMLSPGLIYPPDKRVIFQCQRQPLDYRRRIGQIQKRIRQIQIWVLRRLSQLKTKIIFKKLKHYLKLNPLIRRVFGRCSLQLYTQIGKNRYQLTVEAAVQLKKKALSQLIFQKMQDQIDAKFDQIKNKAIAVMLFKQLFRKKQQLEQQAQALFLQLHLNAILKINEIRRKIKPK